MKANCFIVLLTASYLINFLAAGAEKEEGELKIEVVEKPEKCPQTTKVGDSLAMHYTGRLADGKKFDSSLDRGKTFDFTLGKGMVIQGWEQGLLDMCVGEKRKLIIPPHLGKYQNFSNTREPIALLTALVIKFVRLLISTYSMMYLYYIIIICGVFLLFV